MTTDLKHAGELTYSLGTNGAKLKAQLEEFQANGAVEKLWRHDASLWTGNDEGKWLGWLDVIDQQLADIKTFENLAETVRQKGYKQALLLGMGGSSLCVEVLRLTFGVRTGFPDMHVLDSTVPEQVSGMRKKLDLDKTIVIVSSKSGSTTEPNVLLDYFFAEAKRVAGDKAAEQFIAITDPGSSLEQTAKKLGFGHIFYGVPSIGGRFSALSNFGMIPAAVMGIDVRKLLEHAQNVAKACKESGKIDNNSGAVLGTILGTFARDGRDKITIEASPVIGSLGAWLEQLMAESTGKLGKGLIPVAGEKLQLPDKYGTDRLFVYVRVANAADKKQDAAFQELRAAGQPVVQVQIADKMDLGGEFFRFEFATAMAGAVLKINAFDQPNVQESKDYTKQFLSEYDKTGKLPEDELLYEEDGIKIFADAANKSDLTKAVGKQFTLNGIIAAHLKRVQKGDYFALNAYLDRNESNIRLLEKVRTRVLEKLDVATTLGFGPRFLHSTGQLHKGGPNTGVFLQLTSEDKQDVAIPNEKFTFGTLKNAQSLGDFLALSKRSRRLLRVHLPADVQRGLERLDKAFQAAL
jgi:glucose-6-phosphate isomerase